MQPGSPPARENIPPLAEHGATVAGLAPWVIYWVVANSQSTWFYGALCAWLAAFMLGVSIGLGRLKAFDVITLVFFAGITILGAVIGAVDRDWMDTYAMTLSSGFLSVIAFSSLAFVPLTEQYARDTVPPAVWELPTFKENHRVMTAAVGCVFAVLAVLGYIAVVAPGTSNWTDWVLPFLLVFATARFLQVYPAVAAGRRAQPGMA